MPNEFPRKQLNKQFAFPKHVQNKSCIISKKLMRVCLESKITSINAYEIFNVLYSLTQELIELQKSKSFVGVRSFADFSFCRRLEKQTENRLDLVNALVSEHSQFVRQKLVAQSFEKSGLGLTAVSHIEVGVTSQLFLSLKEGTCVLRIPKDVMLDVSTGSSPEFGSFIVHDPIASTMENVALSLRLLTELVLWSKSVYYNYIRSLPVSYQTFMDMNPDDLKHLRGSTTLGNPLFPFDLTSFLLETLVCNFLFICRQYAYFFNRFQDKSDLQFAKSFCFEDYRWAVSSVMSRNNLIPKGDKGAKQMCMIPIWDMTNHKTGKVTTDFIVESGELIFYAMEPAKPGDQIFMDYGARTSAEFLLFSGFVPAHNPHNHVRATFGISNADPLGSKRKRMLELIGLEMSVHAVRFRHYNLSSTHSPLVCHITDKASSLMDVLAFARVFTMNEGISNADPLGSKRKRMLELIGLEMSVHAVRFRHYNLSSTHSPLVCHITDKASSLMDVLAFARVFTMNEEELDSLLSSNQRVHDDLRSFAPSSPRDVDHKAIDFLVKRFQLLIMAYGSVITVTDPEHANLTPIQQHCELLRTQEIELLRSSIVHLETIRSSPDRSETLSTSDLNGIASAHL
ncbi:hypothetical protein P879_08924 [Paragonimus westermani]|uniref:protein-histidine N-methyltransferase n=1 Tax=Paragonimus westermani TaxID=34504 RepID=A0A8T0DMZ4_9TREM|nr:hypothetical protein P879_08924 [Paragonimus westermani]